MGFGNLMGRVDGALMSSGSCDDNQMYTQAACLSPGAHVLNMKDSYGDGIRAQWRATAAARRFSRHGCHPRESSRARWAPSTSPLCLKHQRPLLRPRQCPRQRPPLRPRRSPHAPTRLHRIARGRKPMATAPTASTQACALARADSRRRRRRHRRCRLGSSCGTFIYIHTNCAWHKAQGSCIYPFWANQCACSCAGAWLQVVSLLHCQGEVNCPLLVSH
eukprot:5129359-Prymnesium_polylepis.1